LSHNLEYIWNRKFDLIYFTGMSREDCNEASAKELEWLHGRLVKQKQDEKNAYEKVAKKEPLVWHKRF